MKRRASTVIQASSTRRSSLRACRAGAMIMGAKAVGGYAMAIDGRAPVERRYPVQSFLFARAASHPARADQQQALALPQADCEYRLAIPCRSAPFYVPGKFASSRTCGEIGGGGRGRPRR